MVLDLHSHQFSGLYNYILKTYFSSFFTSNYQDTDLARKLSLAVSPTASNVRNYGDAPYIVSKIIDMLSKYQLNFWRHFIPICPFNWKTPHLQNNLNLIPSKLSGDCIWYWSYRDWQRAISSLSWYIWCIRENCAGERKLSTRILRRTQLRLTQLF